MKRTIIGLGLAAGLLLAACSAPAAPATDAPAKPAVQAAAPAAPAASPSTDTATRTPSAPKTKAPEPRAEQPKSPRPKAEKPRSLSVIPGDFGTALTDHRLPREGEPATDEVTAFAPADFRLMCLEGVIEAPALADLDASRIRQRMVIEGVDADGLLYFTTEEKATAFMEQVSTAYVACPTPGPESENRGTPDWPIFERTQLGTGTQAGVGEYAFTVRTWTERRVDGDWVVAPGGGVVLWARSGRAVAFSETTGEYVGDAVREAEPGSPLFRAVTNILAEN